MAVQIKGFMQAKQFLSNVVGEVATYGELSNHSISFAKEKGYYGLDTYPGKTLVTFTSLKDDKKVYLQPAYVKNIFKVVQFVLDKCEANGIVETFRTVLLNQMAESLAADGDKFDLGLMAPDATRWLPEWISWRIPTQDGGNNSIVIWLKDEAFQNQYDDYEITVVPPLPRLDDFFLPPTQVKQRLDAMTYEMEMDAVQAAKVKDPETVIRGMIYPWHNPLDVRQTIDTRWTVLIYGAAGDNPDAIQDALIKHILENSTHPESEWTVMFPDIFKRTEFLFMPGWFKLAIEQREAIAGIYSPLVDTYADVNRVRTWVTKNQPDYTAAHLNKATMTFTHNYRTVSVIVVGGPKNRDDKFKMIDWWPDYISIANTNPDFTRMQQITCDFANKVTEAIIFAETWQDGQPLKYGLRKVKRNGKYWLTFNTQRISYLFWPRANGNYV